MEKYVAYIVYLAVSFYSIINKKNMYPNPSQEKKKGESSQTWHKKKRQEEGQVPQ